MSSRRQRRSSILKSRNSIGPGYGADGRTEGFANSAPQTSDGAAGMEPTKSLRRVNFSHTNQVKEFCIERSNSSEEASFSKTSDFNQTMMDNNGQLDMSFAFSDMDRAEERENCPQRGRFSETLLNENLDMSICSQSSVQFKSTIDEIQEKVCMLPPPVPSTTDHVSSRRFDMTIPDPVDMSFAYSDMNRTEDKDRENCPHRGRFSETLLNENLEMSLCSQPVMQPKSTVDDVQQPKMTIAAPPPPPPVTITITTDSVPIPMRFEKPSREAIRDPFGNLKQKKQPNHPYGKFGSCKTPKRNKIQDPGYSRNDEVIQMSFIHDKSGYNSVSDVTSLFSPKYFEVAKKIDNFLKSAGRDDPFLEIDLLTKLSNYLVVLPEAELEYLVQKYDDFFLEDYVSSIYIRRKIKYKFV